ncbi:hypothetical protein HDU76_010298, partial [Blyttiomyces sp. JEL0837]
YKYLSENKSQMAIDLLTESLGTEKHPRALVALTTVSTFRDDKLRLALYELLRRPQLGYTARAACYQNIGRQRHPDDLQFLLTASQDPTLIGMHGIVRGGILRGLGHHRSVEAFQNLLGRLKPGIDGHDRVFVACFGAIAISAEWQESRYRKAACELVAEVGLRHYNYNVKVGAIRSLIAMGGKEHVGTMLRVVESGFPVQDVPGLRRDVVNVLSGAGGDGGRVLELCKNVEVLEKKLKELEMKVLGFESKEKAGLLGSGNGNGGAGAGAGGAAAPATGDAGGSGAEEEPQVMKE